MPGVHHAFVLQGADSLPNRWPADLEALSKISFRREAGARPEGAGANGLPDLVSDLLIDLLRPEVGFHHILVCCHTSRQWLGL
ncbi:hypothetical protein D3C76_1262790 [compost metagenome]